MKAAKERIQLIDKQEGCLGKLHFMALAVSGLQDKEGSELLESERGGPRRAVAVTV